MKRIVSLMLICFTMFSLLGVTMQTQIRANEKIQYKILYETDVYTASKTIDGVNLHYGVNGWQNVKDVKMEYKCEMGTNGQPTKVWYEIIVEVIGNDTIDYAFCIDKKNEPDQWDNNNGKDYHLKITETNIKEPVKYKIIYETDYYNAAKFIKGIKLHYGTNGWKNVKDIPMVLKNEVGDNGVPTKVCYEAVVDVNKNDTIDYAYYIEGSCVPSRWDNNNGNDYHVKVNKTNLDKVYYKISYKEYAYPARYTDVTLHFGLNGWENVKDILMNKRYEGDYAVFEYVLEVYEYETIDYDFFVDTRYYGTYWVNNNGEDFHVTVYKSNLD